MASYFKQMFRGPNHDKYFKKYVETTSTHGVSNVFTGKSIIRRLFWLGILLVAIGGCLHNIIDRIQFLISRPTATTLSMEQNDRLAFPAVTICNLNQYRVDVCNEIHPELVDGLRGVQLAHILSTIVPNVSSSLCDEVDANLTNLTIENLAFTSRDRFDEFILYCFFAGERCKESDFTPFYTEIGYCYTFNSYEVRQRYEALSSGAQAGLHLVVNIDQSQHVLSNTLDAGVKVVVHRQDEPPRPEALGVAIPPGTNGFVSIRQRNVIDTTGKSCLTEEQTQKFNFLKEQFSYSVASCRVDCLLTNIAEKCNCTLQHSNVERFLVLPNCTLSDLCCVAEQQRITTNCGCQAACNATQYITSNSYSGFPAQYVEPYVQLFFNNDSSTNFLSVNVFFETLDVETQTTNDPYGVVALLSDIGGQLGLFLGVSIISIMEFFTWIIDEIRSRLFADKLTESNICSCCKKEVEKNSSSTGPDQEMELKEVMSNHDAS